jgi:hypothetical protein
MKSKEMRLPMHDARTGEIRNMYKILIANTERTHHPQDVGICDRTILKVIL